MGFEPTRASSRIESANEFVSRMNSAVDEAKSALEKARDDMKRWYDRRRVPAPEYKVGEKVWLDANDINLQRASKKLAAQRLGPYKVLAKVGKSAYRLQLPRSLSRLHPVFPTVKLSPWNEDPIEGRRPPPPPEPVLVDGAKEFEVEEILDSRRRYNRLEYLVKWKGYGVEDQSWEPRKNVENAQECIEAFHRKYPDAICATLFEVIADTPGLSNAVRSWRRKHEPARRDAAP
ncbi:hypothetical protein ONZ45_g16577 [Pleurotus djamor]|nr:hypothetical protein ONZ45_g16577 [Pleurotus djamor]